jgi:hypothetical protein
LENDMAKVAFIGLGVMGYPMARHIASKGGHDLVVYNRTAEKAERWVAEHGGPQRCDTARGGRRTASSSSPVSATMTTCAPWRWASLALWPGCAAARSLSTTRRPAPPSPGSSPPKLASAAVGFLDAPVSGGQSGAENGALTVMVGGEQEAFDKARPVIDCYARMVGLMGPAGAGQLTKMVNQICIAGSVQGLSEGIHFAKRAGLDVEQVIGVISKGAAQVLADGEPLQDHERGKVRLRLCRGLDALRTCPSASTRRARTAPSCRSPPLVDQFLCRGPGHGRAPLGHVEPYRPAWSADP